MHITHPRRFFHGLCTPLSFACIIACATTATAQTLSQDHHEFEASLHVPFQSESKLKNNVQSRSFDIAFDFPQLKSERAVLWKLELLDHRGHVMRRWYGEEQLGGAPAIEHAKQRVFWDGRNSNGSALANGIYQVQLSAIATVALINQSPANGRNSLPLLVESRIKTHQSDLITQSWPMQVGVVTPPAMPKFAALPSNGRATGATPANQMQNKNKSEASQAISPSTLALAPPPATASLPYTVYFGNLHSQTNHSDGGGALNSCTGAQKPLSSVYGPSDAYQYALNQGLDFLMTSEHNHMYDGSDSTNTAADPNTAKNLYQSGLSAATSFNSSHAGFLGIYGMEWGVISNGGHLNIFNGNQLLGWEYNSSNQLIADIATTKSDYAALYSLMRQRAWIGQFNHPALAGQFAVNGVPFGFTADGDQAMVACEVLNTAAFSNNATETETGRSSYEDACNKVLEAGFHVAFTSNQDNHCANWGASYTNRSAVLIPNGLPLTNANFIDALKARRVYATMDKNSQLILTANGHVMGERFNNSGVLNLVSNFANNSGRAVSIVSIYEGVPGRNGTVSLLSSSANTRFTPTVGEHFYYAKITQDDGKSLWSAPVWVSQTDSSTDTTAPSVSVAEVGSSGNISLTANASDNVGVTKVEFYIDNMLKATSVMPPYSAIVDSTTLSNGTHNLSAKAYDAANNIGAATPLNFSVNNIVATQLITNGGFESGASSWTASAGVISTSGSQVSRTGGYMAWLNGYGSAHTDTLYQQVSIPSTSTSAILSFWLKVASDETTTTQAYDTLKLQIRNSAGTVLTTLANYSNLNKGSSYVNKTFDLSAYRGQTIRIYFVGVEGSVTSTSFLIDDVSLIVQ